MKRSEIYFTKIPFIGKPLIYRLKSGEWDFWAGRDDAENKAARRFCQRKNYGRFCQHKNYGRFPNAR